MDENISRTCCFTGHRPEKLQLTEHATQDALKQEILRAAGDGFFTFISGMARGTDIIAAEEVLKMRDEGMPLRLVCASPFFGFERGWSGRWKKRYSDVLARAEEVFFICPGYIHGCYQKRNIWMVDRSGLVIAVYAGEQGGTENTISYAQKKGVEVRIIPAFT